MLMLALAEAGLPPSFVVGGDVTDAGTGAQWTGSDLLVVEADESDGTHLELPVFATILTNIEVDHLDHYGSFDGDRRQLRPSTSATIDGPKVLCVDDPRCAALAAATARPPTGSAPAPTSAPCRSTRRRDRSASRSSTTERCSGRSTCRCAACTTSSTPSASWPWRPSSACRSTAIATALGRFGGVARRFDVRGVDGGATFVDDYAHLPTRDRRRARRGAGERRQLEAGDRRLPAESLQPHVGDVARVRRRLRRRRRRRAHGDLSPRGRRRSRASPVASSSTPCSRRIPTPGSSGCRAART